MWGSPNNLDAEIATVIVAECLERLGADAGFVATVDHEAGTLEVARVTQYSQAPVRLTFPLDARYPLAETIRTKQPLYIGSNTELVCDHPGLVRVTEEDHACATVPLLAEDGELLGALNFGFDDPHAFTPEERDLIDVVARHCGQAMSLARHLQSELGETTPVRA